MVEIRPYVYELLMYLVGVHAQVTAAAGPLLERTLNALVEDIADEALRCFRQVKRFGMGGMLRVRRLLNWGKKFSFLDSYPYLISTCKQATLEIEFIHQTVSRYVTPSAAKTLSDLYNKISQAYARKAGDENLQEHLDGVKKTLAETRRATGIEFLCFRQTKDRSKERVAAPTGSRPKERERERVRDKERSHGRSQRERERPKE